MNRGPAAVVPRLHVVTDDAVLARPDFLGRASDVLRAVASVDDGSGADVALHVRGPRTDGRTIHRLAADLLEGADSVGCALVVNDRADVALAVGAAGVHLGARSLSLADVMGLVEGPRVVGVSVHSVADAAAAAEGGASYLVAGHVWATPSHPGEAGRGCTWLREVVGASNAVPVVAIGGVTRDRVPEVLETGAGGVAVLGGIWNEPDPAEAVVDYIQALNA